MKKIIITLLIFTSLIINAQTPQNINYQGILRNQYGTLIANRHISVRITIRKILTLFPVTVYGETHSVTTNRLGLFTLKIGNGNAFFGIFEKIKWGEGSHIVSVEVDENGGTNYHFIGENIFSSVPYSLMSKSTGILQSDMKTVAVSRDLIDFPLNTSAEQSTFNVFSEDGIYNPNNQNLDGLAIINRDQYSRGDVSLKLSSRSLETWDGKHHNQCTIVLNSVATGKDKADFTIQNEYSGSNRVKETFRIKYNGNVGINNQNPKTKLQITNGDVYIDRIGKGVIMKDNNNHCWRFTPSTSGALIGHAISCP